MAEVFRLLERVTFHEGFPSVNMASASNPGAWVQLLNYRRAAIVLLAAPGTDGGTSGDNVIISILQAKDSSGTGSKALAPTAPAFYTKQAATNVEAVKQWTANTPGSPASTVTVLHTSAANDMILAVEVMAEELDHANGFSWISASVAQLTSARTGELVYLLGDPKFPSAPEQMLSAIG